MKSLLRYQVTIRFAGNLIYGEDRGRAFLPVDRYLLAGW